MIAVRSLQTPGRNHLSVAQEGMPGRILRRRRAPDAVEVGRRGDQDATIVGELAHQGGAVDECSDANGHIQAFADEIHDIVVELEDHGEAGMACRETPQHRRHAAPAESDGGADAQRTRRLVAAVGQPIFGGFDRLQSLGDVDQQSRTVLRRAERTGRAVDQPDTGPAFERREALADHGQRDAEPPGRGRQAAFGQDGPERLQLVEVVQHSHQPECESASHYSELIA